MKKMLIIPAVIGLLAVPSLALAHNGADNSPVLGTKSPLNVRHEDRRDMVTPGDLHNTNSPSNPSNDDNRNPHASTTVAPESSISLDQAKAIALGVFPGKTIKAVETEQEHGVIVYSVRFTDDSRVDVQASDGAVLRMESETEGDVSVGANSDKSVLKHGNDNTGGDNSHDD